MVTKSGIGMWWAWRVAGAGIAAALTLIATGCGGSAGPPVTSDVGTYCAMSRSIQLGAPASLDSEGFLVRSLWPLSPQQLRDDYSAVLLAYKQVRDVADGAVSGVQASVMRTPRLVHAMAQIDEYTAAQCGVRIASTLPSMTER